MNLKNIFKIVDNPLHRGALSKLRCSSHKLAIEEGRFRNIDKQDRKCIYCRMNVIENEYHFVLVCPFYRELRMSILPNYFCSWPSIVKFKQLMKCNQTGLTKRLARFVYLAYCKRKNV